MAESLPSSSSVVFARLPRQLRVLFVSYDGDDRNAQSFKAAYSAANDGSIVTIIRHDAPGMCLCLCTE
jgi:glycosyltransferase A (GT-A) superfamily protein (DUF2064 family)